MAAIKPRNRARPQRRPCQHNHWMDNQVIYEKDQNRARLRASVSMTMRELPPAGKNLTCKINRLRNFSE